MTELGLRRDVDLVHHNLGCAGLASGFRTAACSLVSMAPATALVVASNCPSGYFGPEVHDYYYEHQSGLGWLAPLMFADGAGAAVWRSTPRDQGQAPTGLLSVRYETSPDVGLVTYPGGGCLHHTSASNVADHVFLMDGVKVAEVFPSLMARDFEMLQEDWPTIDQTSDRDRLRRRHRGPLVSAPGQRRRGPPGDRDARPSTGTSTDLRRPLWQYVGGQHPDPAGRRPPCRSRQRG